VFQPGGRARGGLRLVGGGETMPIPDDPSKDHPKAKLEPGTVEVRFADDSVLKLVLRDEKVEIVTPYGKLLVPIADIHRIEFATRLSEADAKRIPTLIANLGSPDFPTRDAASAELLKMQAKAYPALLEAVKNPDAEIVRRANDLIDKIRDAVPKENLEVRRHDVVHTADSKITGRISNTSLKAQTTQFGEVQLKLADVRSFRAPGAEDSGEINLANAQPAPQHLLMLQNQIGQTFTFRVTGVAQGALWGTDVYTLDSTLGMAAVHAGLIKVGETKALRVKIIPSPPAYMGSSRNGVTSEPFGAYPAAYQFMK
jgi:hypothetical protein